MLNLNTKNERPLNTTNYNYNYSNTNNSILAFKPRQVILSALHHHHHHNPKPTPTMNLVSNESKCTTLTPEIKVKLDALILNYLNRNGFNKTLKRFRSEAGIETDTWKVSSLHLEDIFCKYNACNTDGSKNTSKKSVFGQDKPIDYDNVYPTNEEPTTKKKKKKGTTESGNGGIVDQSEVIDTKMVDTDTKRVDEPELKLKKKKTKHDLYSSSQAEVKIDTTNELKIDHSTKKTKEKKKTSNQEDKLMPSTSNDNELATDDGEKERKNKKKKSTTDGAVKDEEAAIVKMDVGSENMSSKEKKSSKKRKRDENEDLSNEVTISEESKCQKTQTFEEEKSKKEKINPQETAKKQLDGQTNGKLETNGGEKSDAKSSTKKRRSVTDEPKTVNAFQRVKIDQVEFADEKLQDNSYWAKDGAHIGYGAKAQEILGQVRGRDFRHEKTKKKRGSYRGGSIDLQSHSIKFNYSDEE